MAFREAVFDAEILSFDVAKLLQLAREPSDRRQ